MIELINAFLIAGGLLAERLIPRHGVETWGQAVETNFGIGPSSFELYSEILVGVIFVLLFLGIQRLLKGFPSLTRDKFLKKFESVWLQRVNRPDRPYSIGIIWFKPESRQWVYEGYGYYPDFRRAAKWDTRSLPYDPESRRWHFAGEAYLFDHNTELPTGHGTVFPILTLPHKAPAPGLGTFDGHVSDLNVGAELKVFTISLKHAGNLFRKRTAVSHIGRLAPARVKEYFETAGMLINQRLQ